MSVYWWISHSLGFISCPGRCNILWHCVLVWGPCAIGLNVLLHFRRLWPIAIENRFQSFYYSIIHWLQEWLSDFFFVLVFINISFVSGSLSSAKPALQIEPNSGTLSTQIGASLALTCQPRVEDTSLISQMEWRGPRDNRIEITDKRSPIYVQVNQWRCPTMTSIPLSRLRLLTLCLKT